VAASEDLPKNVAEFERQAAEAKVVGLLVGGLTHDFNNLLTAIGGHAALIAAEAELGSEVEESAGAILKAAEHAAAIVERLRNAAQPREVKKVPMNLNDTVAEVAALLQPTTLAGIEIRSELMAPAAVTFADPDQMHRVVLNLVLNAREAMPDGGLLTIETGQEASHVVITVRDTGHGIVPEIRDRVFEPLFTTRQRGRGAGMGLAVVAGIVELHGGRVAVESQPGVGSTIRVYLPLASKRVAQGTD